MPEYIASPFPSDLWDWVRFICTNIPTLWMILENKRLFVYLCKENGTFEVPFSLHQYTNIVDDFRKEPIILESHFVTQEASEPTFKVG